jgi:hypothetical protein
MRELSARNPHVTVSVNLNQDDAAPEVWRTVLKETLAPR